MSTSFYHWALMVVVVGCLPPVFAEGLLHNDPFARPLLDVQGSAQGADFEPGASWHPQLTAVMLDGKNSLVSLNGEIVGIGDQKDGYRLIRVREQEAVFKKDGKRIVLKMDDAVGSRQSAQK